MELGFKEDSYVLFPAFLQLLINSHLLSGLPNTGLVCDCIVYFANKVYCVQSAANPCGSDIKSLTLCTSGVAEY